MQSVFFSPHFVKPGMPHKATRQRVGPNVFRVNMYDLSDALENSFFLFADDSTICRTVLDPNDRQTPQSANGSLVIWR